MPIEMIPVESTSISEYGYDEDTQTLAITFVSTGATYHYQGVPKEIADGLGAADSAGSYFRHEINGRYSGVKQESEPEGDES